MSSVRTLPFACLLLLACDSSHAPLSDEAPRRSPTKAATFTISIRDGNGIESPFRVGDLRKLTMEVRMAGATPGPHPLRLDVLSPSGALYAQLPLSIDVGAAGDGIDSTDLQVAGTPIESYRQVGAWSFRLARPGAAAPLATAEAEIAE